GSASTHAIESAPAAGPAGAAGAPSPPRAERPAAGAASARTTERTAFVRMGAPAGRALEGSGRRPQDTHRGARERAASGPGPSVAGAAPAGRAYLARISFRIRWTTAGSPFPFKAFIAAPTRRPIALSLPWRTAAAEPA